MRLAVHYSCLAALLVLGQPVLGLEERACRLEAPDLPAAFGLCATLGVPEDPAAPEAAALELFVARIPALSASPRPDPLVLVAGGPGQSTVDLYLQLRAAFEPVRRDRELILLDQRGTGRSASGLECRLPPGIEPALTPEEQLEDALEACLSALTRDARFFTTSVAVRDLEQLRVALGLEQWNLYGISYGTRVAQHYLRRYPERTRSLILDGIVPAELTLGPDIATKAQDALDAIFARCAAEPDCAARFPDLTEGFARIRRALAAEALDLSAPDPVNGREIELRFGAAELSGVIRLMTYSAQTAALLPLVVSEAADGNFRPLAAQARIVMTDLSASLSFAMHNAVICTEDVPFFPDDAASGARDAYLGSTVTAALRSICARWPRGVMDPELKSPVISSRPVLLLSGEHDPVTPPSYGNAVIAAGLRNAVHLIGPGQGHGLAPVGCVPRLMRAFLDEPVPEQLDGQCLTAEPAMPFFLSFQGPAP